MLTKLLTLKNNSGHYGGQEHLMYMRMLPFVTDNIIDYIYANDVVYAVVGFEVAGHIEDVPSNQQCRLQPKRISNF